VETNNIQIQYTRKDGNNIMDEHKREYQTYTEEFKLEALELPKRSREEYGQIEHDLGIKPGLLLK
jgi:transposase-like protein